MGNTELELRDSEGAGEEAAGVLAVSEESHEIDEVTPEMLLRAYQAGIFPMAPARDSEELDWYCPAERGIVPLEKPHFPRRLMRTVMAGTYEVCADKDFPAMMAACAAPAPGREETWISPRICALYTALFEAGYAHSVEVRNREGELVGGLYGVAIQGAFFGESMVSRVRDASKIALVHLVAALRKGGFTLLDTQYVTPHLARLGGQNVPFSRYKALLDHALWQRAQWPEDISLAGLQEEFATLKRFSAVNRD